jgi:REP-associated tyrosine transposase
MPMARQPRFFVPGEVLHVIQRGNNREPIFAAEEDYRFLLDCLVQASRVHGVFIHAYVLMTNHLHLLATPKWKESLPKALQSVGRRYVQYFNGTYQRSGTLWEGRYRATVVDSEQYLLTCMRYIELNPVRAGMVAHPGEYRWTSYHSNAQGAANVLVSRHELYERLGRSGPERQRAYRQLFRAQLSSVDVEAIREATNKNWALGNERFKQRIEALSGRRSDLMRMGRPAKANRTESRV